MFVFITHYERLFQSFNGCPDIFAGVFLAYSEILIAYANLPKESTSRIKWIFPVTKGKRSTSIVKSFGGMRLRSADFRLSFLNF